MNEWLVVAGIGLAAISGLPGLMLGRTEPAGERIAAGCVIAGAIGRAAGRPELIALGLAGGLLHVWNHGVFKRLLFLCAGSVLHQAHTRELGSAHAYLLYILATLVVLLIWKGGG